MLWPKSRFVPNSRSQRASRLDNLFLEQRAFQPICASLKTVFDRDSNYYQYPLFYG